MQSTIAADWTDAEDFDSPVEPQLSLSPRLNNDGNRRHPTTITCTGPGSHDTLQDHLSTCDIYILIVSFFLDAHFSSDSDDQGEIDLDWYWYCYADGSINSFDPEEDRAYEQVWRKAMHAGIPQGGSTCTPAHQSSNDNRRQGQRQWLVLTKESRHLATEVSIITPSPLTTYT